MSQKIRQSNRIVRLQVDRRSAHAQTPPPNAVLDARADRLLVGAALMRHAHALAPEQVRLLQELCFSFFFIDQYIEEF